MSVPGLTNWIKPPVDRKGSSSARLTYEEDWHGGWSRQGVGGERVAESRCVCHHKPGIMLKERKHDFSDWTLTGCVGSILRPVQSSTIIIFTLKSPRCECSKIPRPHLCTQGHVGLKMRCGRSLLLADC